MDTAGSCLDVAGGALRMAPDTRIPGRKPSLSKVWRWGAGLVVGILCLWLTLRNLNLDQVWTALREAKAWALIAALSSVISVALIKAARWWWLYPEEHRPDSWRRVFPVLVTSQMLNMMIPIRLGELARMGLMLHDGIPAAVTLSTIVIEKSLDMVAVGVIILLVLPSSLLPIWFPASAGITMGVSGVVLLIALLLVWMKRGWITAFTERVLASFRWLPPHWQVRLTNLVSKVLAGLGALTYVKTVLPILVLTALSWLVGAFTMLAMLAAFGLPAWWHVAIILSLNLYLSYLVPTPPALVGVVSAVTLMTLQWFEMSRANATALGLTLNLVLVAPVVLMGGWATWLRFSRLTTGTFKDRWVWSLGLTKRESQERAD